MDSRDPLWERLVVRFPVPEASYDEPASRMAPTDLGRSCFASALLISIFLFGPMDRRTDCCSGWGLPLPILCSACQLAGRKEGSCPLHAGVTGSMKGHACSCTIRPAFPPLHFGRAIGHFPTPTPRLRCPQQHNALTALVPLNGGCQNSS